MPCSIYRVGCLIFKIDILTGNDNALEKLDNCSMSLSKNSLGNPILLFS